MVFLSQLNLDGLRRTREDMLIDSWLDDPDFLLDEDDFNEDAAQKCGRGWHGTKPPGCKRGNGKGGSSPKGGKTVSALSGGFKGLGSSTGTGKSKAARTRANTQRQVAQLKKSEKLQNAVAKRFEEMPKDTPKARKAAKKVGKMLKAAGVSRGYLNSVMKGF